MGGRVLAVGCCGPLSEEGWGIAQPCAQADRMNSSCLGMGCCWLFHDHGHVHALVRQVDFYLCHAPCLSQTPGMGSVRVNSADCRRAAENDSGHAVVCAGVVVRAYHGDLDVGGGAVRSGRHGVRRIVTTDNGCPCVRWTVEGVGAVRLERFGHVGAAACVLKAANMGAFGPDSRL